MLVSTKGRYALRVMIDLAEHHNGEFIPLKDVADRQDISLKYLEKILPVLTKSRLLEGAHGKGGGYRLKRDPEAYTVWEILQIAEGDLAPVSCLEEAASPCDRAPVCRTLPMWRQYYELTRDFFSGITLASLMRTEIPLNYVI